MFFWLHVGLEQWEVWGVKSAVWSVKCEGSSGKWKVWSVECEVWSVKFQFGVRRAQCEVWSVKCEVWSVKEAVRSEKCEVLSVECEVWSVKFQFGVRRAQCEVWSVKCGVWSLKFGVRRVQCEVWSVECEVWSLECEECSVKCGVWSVKTLLRLSLKKSNGCRGKDTVGTGCLWTIGHLCLGNFRRRLARVYVKMFFLFGMEWYGWAWLHVAPLGANSNKEAFRLTMQPSSAGPKLAHWSTEILPKEAFWLEDTRRYYNIL